MPPVMTAFVINATKIEAIEPSSTRLDPASLAHLCA